MSNRSIRPVIFVLGSMAALGCHASPPRTALAEPAETIALPATAIVSSQDAPHPSPSAGETAERPYSEWTVRAWGGVVGRYVETDNVTDQDPTFGTTETSWPDSTFGLGFDVERRLSKLFGLDLGVGYTNLETEFSHSVGTGEQTDDLGVVPVWLALNLHVIDNESIDVYFGPQIAYFFYLNDLSYEVPGVGTKDVETDNEFPSLGFLVGTDVSLGREWALNFAFRFQDADADSDHDLPLDPTFVTIGVSRRF